MDYHETSNCSQAHHRDTDSTFLRQLLELLNIKNDLNFSVKCYLRLGLYFLKENKDRDKIIKSEIVYKKLTIILESRLQSKVIIALNFISVLLYIEDEKGITQERSLNIYAKNKLRINGCLAAMIEIFMNSMVYHDTWRALCRSISETCNGNTTNQTNCSLLVPLCIQKCQRGDLEPIIVLRSLLSRHQRNIKLFYEKNGMTIFTRETLQNSECLQLLNLIVENTGPDTKHQLLKESHLFHVLNYFLQKYGLNSSIGQWASITLYTCRKVIGSDLDMESYNEDVFTRKCSSYMKINEHFDMNNDTRDLFRNVLREVFDWQRQNIEKPIRNKAQTMYDGHRRSENSEFKSEMYKEQPITNTTQACDFQRQYGNDSFKYELNKEKRITNIAQTSDWQRQFRSNRFIDELRKEKSITNTIEALHWQRPIGINRFKNVLNNEEPIINTTQGVDWQRQYRNDSFKHVLNKKKSVTNTAQAFHWQRQPRSNRFKNVLCKENSITNTAQDFDWQRQYGNNIFKNEFNKDNPITDTEQNLYGISRDNIHNKVNDKDDSLINTRFSFINDHKSNNASVSSIYPLEASFKTNSKRVFRRKLYTPNDFSTKHNGSDTISPKSDKSYRFSFKIDDEYVRFKPRSVSTPKRILLNKRMHIIREPQSASTERITSYNCNKSNVNSILHNKSLRNTSMSAKLMGIVNGSCASIIRGFKNIFNRKASDIKNKKGLNKKNNESFVKPRNILDSFIYTRKSDSIRQKERDSLCSSKHSSNFNSCNTCNDTVVLKHKFSNDVFLQQTVKRLKLGINLYGCDFKKISRTLWPRETYMKPSVLYNLYRKLIVER